MKGKNLAGSERDFRAGSGAASFRNKSPRMSLDEGDEPPPRVIRRKRMARPSRGRSPLARTVDMPRLYTATIAYADGDVMLQAFHASVACHPAQVVQRLRSRFGDDVLPVINLRQGFHPAAPIVIALVPEPVADMIRETERGSARPAALSFVVDIEQRIEI
ncbi:hypothetical protein [Sphingomonas sp. BK069]|uniref:hypothetical protein n=1 Tax=Sphingomonas sp. BK069 TaxID=2586979 RepID=UPI001610BEB9|nr:hypothetical protein [Sphingomonas sp. BK069]MBB3348400.1 hypothetical protein [Sphingomonas sp. BK069]